MYPWYYACCVTQQVAHSVGSTTSLIATLLIHASCHQSWDLGLCLHVTVAGPSDIPLKSLWKQPSCHYPCILHADPVSPVRCDQTPRTHSFSNLRVTCQDTINVPIGSLKHTRFLARSFFSKCNLEKGLCFYLFVPVTEDSLAVSSRALQMSLCWDCKKHLASCAGH